MVKNLQDLNENIAVDAASYSDYNPPMFKPRSKCTFLILLLFIAFSAFVVKPTLASQACTLAQNNERICRLNIESKPATKAGYTNLHAMSINGQIPGPQLNFKVGETAVIHVTNSSSEITTLHWHGILVPWNMDGPMFSNNKPIEPGETFVFRFEIKHKGTYWYHSHTGLQEQRGLYGPIVIRDGHNHETLDEKVLVLSDWSVESPKQILANIKSDGHYYEYKKNSQTSWLGAIRHGAVWDYIKSQWSRMGTMDLSDIGYDAFLINGEKDSTEQKHLMPGQKVKLRIINAGASSYFYFNIGNNRSFTVISKDGVDVEPVMVSEILMGMGETYDVIFTIPEHKLFEIRATSQDVTGFASLKIGMGQLESVPMRMKPNPYKMDHDSGHDGNHGGDEAEEPGADAGHGGHGDHSVALLDPKNQRDLDMPMTKRLNYEMLKATTNTAFPDRLPRYDIELELDGDMERYLWTINGTTFSEDKYIDINEGDVVRFTMVNNTMMHHPMHLHGHFFRILNGRGHKAPLAHTVDVGPMKIQTIEFLANEPGTWFFHCHNLYHMKMGMAKLVKYRGFEQPKYLKDSEMKHMKYLSNDKTSFLSGDLGIFTNHAEMNAKINMGRYEVELEVEMDDFDFDSFEADIMFKRYLSRYFSVVTGGEYTDRQFSALLGIQWELPLKVQMMMYINHRGQTVVKMQKEFHLADRVTFVPAGNVRFNSDGRTEFESEAKLMYRLSKRVKAGFFYEYEQREDKDDHTIGIGVSIQLGSKELQNNRSKNDKKKIPDFLKSFRK